MQEAKVYNVKYASKAGETSERTIIPTYVPKQTSNVKALDVSALTQGQRAELLELVGSYQQYKDQYIKTMFTLENFIEHTTGKPAELKFRTFIQENLEVVE